MLTAAECNKPLDFVAALVAAGFLMAAAGALRFCGVGLLGDLHMHSHHSRAVGGSHTSSCQEARSMRLIELVAQLVN